MDLTPFEPYISLVVALAMGLLIGLERERQSGVAGTSDSGDPVRRPQRPAGARTFPLLALMGALAALLAPAVGVWLVVAGFAGVIGFATLAYYQQRSAREVPGLTTEVAMAVTYLLGALALTRDVLPVTEQRLILVAMLGVTVTALLSAKPLLHELASRVSQEDAIATVKFLIVAVIGLPLLPDRAFGPLGALNPRSIGWMVVLIAGISFTGYVAARIFGSRGLALTGLIGGLVSSTAVMASFSPRAKEHPELHTALTMAVVGSSSVMFPRVLVEVGVVNRELLPAVAVPFGVMTVTGALVTVWLYRRTVDRTTQAPEVPLRNPFELASALWFGALFAVVLVVSKAATAWFGAGGTYAAGLLAGATDVDAITLSVAHLAAEDLIAAPVAATTILLGALSNTVVKAVMAVVLGGWAFGSRVAVAMGFILATGAVALAGLWLFGG